MIEIKEKRTNGLMVKAALLYKELNIASEYFKNLRGTLENWDDQKYDVITDIGYPYIKKMPKFKIFQNEAENIKNSLRRVCSGEITREEAIEKIKEIEEDINEVLDIFDEKKLMPYIM